MTPESSLAPAPAPAPAVPDGVVEQEEDSSWDRPITDPSRNALIASAAEKLAESARRFAELQARLDALSAPPSPVSPLLS